jgi:hypothetical protein
VSTILDDYRMNGFPESGLTNEPTERLSSFFTMVGEIKLQFSYVSRKKSVVQEGRVMSGEGGECTLYVNIGSIVVYHSGEFVFGEVSIVGHFDQYFPMVLKGSKGGKIVGNSSSVRSNFKANASLVYTRMSNTSSNTSEQQSNTVSTL